MALVATLLLHASRRRKGAALPPTAIEFVRSSFASRLAHDEPLAELLLQAAETLHDTFALDAAEVWLETASSLALVAAEPPRTAAQIPLTDTDRRVIATAPVAGAAWARIWLPGLLDGRADGPMRVAPITHGGHLLGLIVLERRADGDQLANQADLPLGELTREIGAAVNKARVDAALRDSVEQLRQQAVELQASRARIVAAADDERRRIELDLHDGAQQYLVAVAVKARLVQTLVATDPTRGRELIEEMIGDVQTALVELRILAHGIYPPLLTTGGLRDALSAAGRRAPIPVALDFDGIGRYPPDREGAVYFCVVEALQNVAKYAGGAASAWVRLWEADGSLRFEIRDDGAGFDLATRSAGAGITNMADRMGAVGGTFGIESAPGNGTTVTGAVSLHPPSQDGSSAARPAEVVRTRPV